VGDDTRLGLSEEVVRADGMADELADVGLAEAGCGGKVGEGGSGADGKGVREAELGDGFGAGEVDRLVGCHDVLFGAEEEVAEFVAVVDDGLAGEDDLGVGVGREELQRGVFVE